jgi:hypothetical protein
MHVEAINIGPTDAIAPVESVTAVAGVGLQGDRHFYRDGPAGVRTLKPGLRMWRRRGVTASSRGAGCAELVGKRCWSASWCLGVELCEP